MQPDPRMRRGDWLVNAELLAEEIESCWPVRVHQLSTYHDIGSKRAMWVCEAVAVLTPHQEGWPHSVRTLVPVDRQYVTPYDRAKYMALYQLWIALDAIELPARPAPQ